MKKLIYTALSLVIAGSAALAQTPVQGRPGHKDASTNIESPVKNRHNKDLGKATVEEWYDPIDWLNAFTAGGSSVQTFVDFLMPDSIAQYRDNGDTVRRFYSMRVGQVIDPKDNVIQNTDNPGIQMSQFTRYSMDSFYLSYIYVRNVDSVDNQTTGQKEKVVDTLQVFYLVSGNGLTRATSPLGTAPNQFIYALPSWSIANFRLNTFIASEKFTLTDADSTFAVANQQGQPESSWRLKTMVKKVGPSITVNPSNNNFVGLIFNFIPGMPYDSNSIMIYQRAPETFPADKKRVNYFGYRFAQNTAAIDAQWRSTTFVNHSLFSDKENAYFPGFIGNNPNPINNGWEGFIPGNAFFQSRNIFCGVFLKSQNVGNKENELVSIANIYPNPASGSTNIGLNLKKAGNVTITVTNLIGQTILTQQAGTMDAGQNKYELNLNGIKTGVYFVTVSVNGSSITQKLTITE